MMVAQSTDGVPEAPVAPVAEDSRGIVDPSRFVRSARLERYPPGPALEGLIDRFWTVTWSLPSGVVNVPQVLQHPCANAWISHGEADDNARPGPLEAMVEGVQRTVSSRRLGGTGWCVAAMTTPGGLGAFVTTPATALTDRAERIQDALDLDAQGLIAALDEARSDVDRVELLAKALTALVDRADPDRVATARHVAAVAKLVETDRSLRLIGELSEASGIGVRTLQRLFREYVGVSPGWVIRRYRLLDTAELVRGGQQVSWADVAADLGYSDQAHLVRDFRGALGTTPAAYARAQQSFAPDR